jgi:hypothetical protein
VAIIGGSGSSGGSGKGAVAGTREETNLIFGAKKYKLCPPLVESQEAGWDGSEEHVGGVSQTIAMAELFEGGEEVE